jgi:hypothetical protein
MHSESSISMYQVSIEYGLSEMMNTQAMGITVSKLAPNVSKWFPDLPELEADFPAGTIDHSAEPIYPEVSAFQLSLQCSIHLLNQILVCSYQSGRNPSWRQEADTQA